MGRVLIVANPQDLHVQLVQKSLARRGRAASVLHIARFAQTATLSLRPTNPVQARVLDTETETPVDLDDVDAVWYRRQGRPDLPHDLADPDDRAFALREWEHALDGIFFSLDARMVNPVGSQRAAGKPRQLAVAARCGLRVPATLVTSDPGVAEDFVDDLDGRVVHKAMSPPRHRFAATQRWRQGDRSFLAELVVAPGMFQEEIAGHSDVRATVVGERVLAARIESSSDHVDSRLSPDAPCEPWSLPDDVHEALLRTMDALGLVFGTVDLKITHENDYVFLEVNPQGQFLYVEILTGLPITEALADLLASPPEP